MKNIRVFAPFLILALIAFGSCEKEYVEPFNFHLTGTFDGSPLQLEMGEDFTSVTDRSQFRNFVFGKVLSSDSCVGNNTAYEEQSRWENLSGATTAAEEKSWYMNFSACVSDSTEDRLADMLTLGEQTFRRDDDIPFGVEIRYWEGNGGSDFYSTRYGNNDHHEFMVTRHKKIDGQEFGYITDGRFSCTLFNLNGDSIVMEVNSFRMQTMSTGL